MNRLCLSRDRHSIYFEISLPMLQTQAHRSLKISEWLLSSPWHLLLRLPYLASINFNRFVSIVWFFHRNEWTICNYISRPKVHAHSVLNTNVVNTPKHLRCKELLRTEVKSALCNINVLHSLHLMVPVVDPWDLHIMKALLLHFSNSCRFGSRLFRPQDLFMLHHFLSPK